MRLVREVVAEAEYLLHHPVAAAAAAAVVEGGATIALDPVQVAVQQQKQPQQILPQTILQPVPAVAQQNRHSATGLRAGAGAAAGFGGRDAEAAAPAISGLLDDVA